MPLLLLLLLPVLEIYVLVKVGARIGAMNTFFALVAIGVIGAGLARSQGRFIFNKLQTSLARGEMPTSEVLQGVLVFLAGVLFLIPGFVSDVAALFLVLPGTRHLIAGWMRRKMAAKMSAGGFRVFSAGPFGSGAFGGFGTGPFRPSGPQPRDVDLDLDGEARDVTPKVIDVTPLSSESRPKSDSDENRRD